MPGLLDRFAGVGAVLLIVLAGLAAAAKVPYPVVVLLAGAGAALAVGAGVLATQRAAKALDVLAAASGTAVAARDEDGRRWFGDRGFFDIAGQTIPRLRVRTADVAGGSAAMIEARIGAGSKPAVLRAAVLSVPLRVPGSLCVVEKTLSGRLRAKMLGGAVETGSALDESFLVFAPNDAEAKAAAPALDPAAIEALFARVRRLGSPQELELAIASGRASLLVGRPPAALFAPESVREVFEGLAACVRGSR